jgi:hypothetical protein
MLPELGIALLVFAVTWFTLLGNVFALLRLFFKFALNVFFREIRVVGHHHVPKKGPVIFAVARKLSICPSVIIVLHPAAYHLNTEY